MSKFLLLLDYNNRYLTSIPNLHEYISMDVGCICNLLKNYGHAVEVKKYYELDLTRQYKGYYVLYQTSEDIGVFYKDYIEDIAYYLQLQGAILLPEYTFLLAHHNKNFMELLRLSFKDESLKTIKSRVYGTAEEAIVQVDHYPVVLKSAEGRGSRNVYLANNKAEFIRTVKQISGVFIVNDLRSLKEFVIYRVALALNHKVQSIYRRHTFYRKKFIVQNFIEGLQGDYKVLYFGGKYYALYRKNRDNDFRASGSGRLFPVNESDLPGLLDFARRLTSEIEFPIIGMDIGFDGKQYHLFEFQCIHNGPYTLQASQYWHEYRDGKWIKYIGGSNLEEEFCRTINDYIQGIQ